MIPWTWCPSPGTAHNPCCVAGVVPGRRVRGPLVTLQSWVTESHVQEPSQSAAQGAAGTEGACEALGHKQEGSSILSWEAFWSLKAACKILLTDTGKSRADVQASLRTRAPRKESLGSQKVICEGVEGKRSLLSKDRFPKVFCWTRKNETTDWPDCLNFRQQPLGGAHTVINTLRRGSFISKLSFKVQFRSRVEFTNMLLLNEAEKQPPHLNPSRVNLTMAGLRSSWWQQGGGHRIYLRIGHGLFLEETEVMWAHGERGNVSSPRKGPVHRGHCFSQERVSGGTSRTQW